MSSRLQSRKNDVMSNRRCVDAHIHAAGISKLEIHVANVERDAPIRQSTNVRDVHRQSTVGSLTRRRRVRRERIVRLAREWHRVEITSWPVGVRDAVRLHQ
mgnify:CR=1 FL=1